MALMRYVGPYPEVRVVVAGNEMGNVENGGAIVVPDELASEVDWSEHWENAADDSQEQEKVKAEQEAEMEALSEPSGIVNVHAEPGMGVD